MVNLWIALALGVIFIIIPVVVMGTLGVNMFGKMLKGFFSMALKVGVIALFVYWLVQWDSFVFDVLFVIAMLFYSAVEVKVRARLRSTSYVIPVLAGLFAGTMLTGAGFLLVNITSLAALSARFVLPVFAILLTGTADVLARSMSMYYAGLRHHNQFYYYMLGNGATHHEALGYLTRRAVQQAAARGISALVGGTSVGAGAAMMWAMIMGGSTVLDAVVLFVLLLLGVFCSSIVATVVAVKVARRYSLDAYGRMKNTK